MGFGAARLNLRLFIDGIEVPVVGARCTFAEGRPASAEIQLVATDQVYGILPRSAVHLFYYEWDLVKENYSAHDLRRWKLLFMGEIIGIAFQRNDSQRAALLTCMCPTTYWDQVKQHYCNFTNGGVEMFENAFAGVRIDKQKFFDVTTMDVASRLYVWLSNSQVKLADGKKYSSLYMGLQRVLREMFFSANVFYARAFNRWRMGDLIVGLPEDKTAAQLFKLDWFAKFIKNRMGGMGGWVGMRQVLDVLLGTVLHTYVTVPCPKFDPAGVSKGHSIAVGDDAFGQSMTYETWPNATLNYIVIKPDTWFLSPPSCNVIFPHQYNSVSFQRNYIAEPTRLFFRTSLLFTGQDKWLTERFYAPDIGSIYNLIYTDGGFNERMAFSFLPHENWVGINGIEEWHDDIDAYVAKGPRRDYLAQLANYTFWRARYSSRTANVSGYFNPDILPGYPGVVLCAVGNAGEPAKHILGNVQTVVHSVDQQGGWTHITMVAVRFHDEQADFDTAFSDENTLKEDHVLRGKGRTLEELANRGTDGFLDSRYEIEAIGDNVYQPLFGCGSIIDTMESALSDVDNEAFWLNGTSDSAVAGSAIHSLLVAAESIEKSQSSSEADKTLPNASLVLQGLYQTAVASACDVHAFGRAITYRPKASMVDVMGVPVYANLTDEEAAVIGVLWNDVSVPSDGFLSVLVDPDAPDHANAVYTKNNSRVTGTTYTYVSGSTTLTQAEFDAVTDPDKYAAYSAVRHDTYASSGTEQISYQLDVHLRVRQAKVRAYVESLVNRGMRG